MDGIYVSCQRLKWSKRIEVKAKRNPDKDALLQIVSTIVLLIHGSERLSKILFSAELAWTERGSQYRHILLQRSVGQSLNILVIDITIVATKRADSCGNVLIVETGFLPEAVP